MNWTITVTYNTDFYLTTMHMRLNISFYNKSLSYSLLRLMSWYSHIYSLTDYGATLRVQHDKEWYKYMFAVQSIFVVIGWVPASSNNEINTGIQHASFQDFPFLDTLWIGGYCLPRPVLPGTDQFYNLRMQPEDLAIWPCYPSAFSQYRANFLEPKLDK